MNEEETIKRCKKITTEKFNLDYSIDNIDKEAIETVLNLLEKKNKTITSLVNRIIEILNDIEV